MHFVTDEHGVFQGIITLNDILEALMQQIFYEDEFKLVCKRWIWLVDGHYSLHDFLAF